MNEVIIAWLMLMVFGAFSAIYALYVWWKDLWEARAWSHWRVMMKNPGKYYVNWRGDMKKN